MPDTTTVPLACPFCGETRDLEVDNSDTHPYSWVVCHGCGTRGSAGKGHDVAVECWNRRASHPEAQCSEADWQQLVAENERWAREANRCDDYISAYVAACAFIDVHAGDHDLTDEMVKAYAEFQKWREHIKAHHSFSGSASPSSGAQEGMSDQDVERLFRKWWDTPGSTHADLIRAAEAHHGIPAPEREG